MENIINNRKFIFGSGAILLVILTICIFIFNKSDSLNQNENNQNKNDDKKASSLSLEGMVIGLSDDYLKIQDKDSIIYTFNNLDNKVDLELGQNVLIEYSGVLNKNTEYQDSVITKYTAIQDTNDIPTSWLDDGIFSTYYKLAYNKLKTLNIDEKIGELLLVRVPTSNKITDLKKYNFGGYLLFERDFTGKTKKEVQEMIKSFQDASKLPLITAVDEEGGKVTRISKNTNLVSAPFKSSQELYSEGGFELIKNDTIKKSQILNELGLNVNLAPVVDVSTNPDDYMYSRSFGKDATLTSEYASTVIKASKNEKVSYTLKHFPGYGNNSDTHTGTSIDSRTYEEIINNDILPFKAGIKAGAEAVLVSHNTVTSIDRDNPASLSASIHNLLRNELGFTGIIITDDLDMGAITNTPNAVVKAIMAGNDLLIVTDYTSAVSEIKEALADGTLSENTIDKLAFRVLAWKYYKGLFLETK